MVIKYKILLSWGTQHKNRKYCSFNMHNIMHKECNLLHGYMHLHDWLHDSYMTDCMTSKKEHALNHL